MQRIYLFTEDLLGIISCISISAHPHRYPCPQRSSSPSLSSHPQELCGNYFKMSEDLLKNSNKPQKINPGSCWLLLEQSIVGEMISLIDFRISNRNSILNCFYWRSILFYLLAAIRSLFILFFFFYFT